MKPTAKIAAVVMLAALLFAGGCVGEQVRRVGARVERGVEMARMNQLELLGKYEGQRKFVLAENGRLLANDLWNIKADPKTGKLPAAALPAYLERVDALDAKKDALRDEITHGKATIAQNDSEIRKGLELMYRAAEAYGDKETVEMRLDQLTDLVRIVAQRQAEAAASAAAGIPSPAAATARTPLVLPSVPVPAPKPPADPGKLKPPVPTP